MCDCAAVPCVKGLVRFRRYPRNSHVAPMGFARHGVQNPAPLSTCREIYAFQKRKCSGIRLADGGDCRLCGDYARLRDMQRDILRGHTPRTPMMDTAMSSSTRVKQVFANDVVSFMVFLFIVFYTRPIPATSSLPTATMRFSMRVLIWLTMLRERLNSAATSPMGLPASTYA